MLKFPNSEYITNEVIDDLEGNDMRDTPPKVPKDSNGEFKMPETAIDLPFERIKDEDFGDLFYAHNLTATFDEIKVQEHMKEREQVFESLTQQDQETIKKAIVQYANDNDGGILLAMRLTGRETDRTLSDELEEKYVLNADKIRIATEMFRATYAMWEMNNIVKEISYVGNPSAEQIKQMEERLSLLEESSAYLEHFQVPATHGTSSYAAPIITKGEVLLKSDTGEADHFEGDGVYAGVLGSDKNYKGREDVFEFTVPFADTLPIIASYNYPKARVCILGEGLDIQKREYIIATASGLHQWRQLEFEYDSIDTWKLDLLEKVLGTKPQIYVYTEDVETVVADTDKEPIHWAMACRSLRIPRFIPKSELRKSDIIYHKKKKQ